MLVRSAGLISWYFIIKFVTVCFNALHLVPEPTGVSILPERSNTNTISTGCRINTVYVPAAEFVRLAASATTTPKEKEAFPFGIPSIVTFCALDTLVLASAGNLTVMPSYVNEWPETGAGADVKSHCT